MKINLISIEASLFLLDRSRSTLWRNIAEGKFTQAKNNINKRAMILWDQVVSQLIIPMNENEIELLLKADAGDAQAQNEIGQFFLQKKQYEFAMYWLLMSADKDNTDSMQWISHCYINGKGVEKNIYYGIMWLAKASSKGDVIAKAQMYELMPVLKTFK